MKYDRLLWIPAENLTEADFDRVRRRLTVSGGPDIFGKEDIFKIYEWNHTTMELGVPRHFGQEMFGSLGIEEAIQFPNVIHCAFNGELREKHRQPEAAQSVLNSYAITGGATLSLPCGWGKTVVSLYIVSQVKLKTLVIVRTEALLDQWIERINEFLPGAKVGRIQGDVCDVENKDIVIGMVQSLCQKDYGITEHFGHVIVDEAHMISAPKFSRALLRLSPKYTLGLTATPRRRDGLERVFMWFLGDVVFKEIHDKKPRIQIYKTGFSGRVFMLPNGVPNFAKMINELASNDDRCVLLAREIARYADEGRKILVLSDRRKQLTVLNELVKIHGCEAETDFYVGGRTPEEREAASTANIIFGTYGIAREGLDIPDLDTLVMATPVGNVEQAIGRILREHPAKQEPLVLDFSDEYSVFEGLMYKRIRYYKDRQYDLLIVDCG